MDDRADDRHVMDRLANVFIQGKRLSALLYDLSIGGCMVECAKPLLELGDDIRVNLVNHFDASGEVVWASGRYVGIRFDAALHEAVVRFSGFNPTVSENPFLHPCDRFGRKLAPQPLLSGLTAATDSFTVSRTG